VIKEAAIPQFRFGPDQVASFAPFEDTVKAFAERHGLLVSSLKDNDHAGPDPDGHVLRFGSDPVEPSDVESR
jgi:hypothetical protein